MLVHLLDNNGIDPPQIVYTPRELIYGFFDVKFIINP